MLCSSPREVESPAFRTASRTCPPPDVEMVGYLLLRPTIGAAAVNQATSFSCAGFIFGESRVEIPASRSAR
jgi:hypothetical protein